MLIVVFRFILFLLTITFDIWIIKTFTVSCFIKDLIRIVLILVSIVPALVWQYAKAWKSRASGAELATAVGLTWLIYWVLGVANFCFGITHIF